jgi:hypothetical protein
MDRVILLGTISGILYLWFSKYDNLILYFGYTSYFIYAPMILSGLLLFRNFKGDYDQFFVNWFFRFIMSLMFFYVPTMILFTFLNSFYIQNKPIKFLTVPLEKTVSNKTKNARILVKIKDETKFIYGYTKELDEIAKDKPSTYKVALKYKVGLFGTYHIERYSIYKDTDN